MSHIIDRYKKVFHHLKLDLHFSVITPTQTANGIYCVGLNHKEISLICVSNTPYFTIGVFVYMVWYDCLRVEGVHVWP